MVKLVQLLDEIKLGPLGGVHPEIREYISKGSVGNLSLRDDETLTTLGPLKKVNRGLELNRCKNLKSLGNLLQVGQWLDLNGCENLTSLGKLEYVGDFLDLSNTKITSLGNLKQVGGNLYLIDTPIAKMYSKEEIREMVEVEGGIILT